MESFGHVITMSALQEDDLKDLLHETNNANISSLTAKILNLAHLKSKA